MGRSAIGVPSSVVPVLSKFAMGIRLLSAKWVGRRSGDQIDLSTRVAMILILHVKKQRAFATGTEWCRSTVFPLLCGGLPDSGFELRGFDRRHGNDCFRRYPAVGSSDLKGRNPPILDIRRDPGHRPKRRTQKPRQTR